MILSIRGAGYVFTATDYDSYVQERAAVLQSARLRRAALMTGGIIWCLIVSEVSFSEALHGPTTATTIHGHGFFYHLAIPVTLFVTTCSQSWKLRQSVAVLIATQVLQFFFIYSYICIFIYYRSRSTMRRVIMVAHGSAMEDTCCTHAMGWTTREIFQTT